MVRLLKLVLLSDVGFLALLLFAPATTTRGERYLPCGPYSPNDPRNPLPVIDHTIRRMRDGAVARVNPDSPAERAKMWLKNVYQGNNVDKTEVDNIHTEDCQFISDNFPQFASGKRPCSDYDEFIIESQCSFGNWQQEITSLDFATYYSHNDEDFNYHWHLDWYQSETGSGGHNDNPIPVAFAAGVSRYSSRGIFDVDMFLPGNVTNCGDYIIPATNRSFGFQTVMNINMVKHKQNEPWKIWRIQKAFDNMKLAYDIGRSIYYDDNLSEVEFPSPVSSNCQRQCTGQEPGPFLSESKAVLPCSALGGTATSGVCLHDT